MKIFVLGVNGFIGNCLVRRILQTSSWRVVGLDLESNKLTESLGDEKFRFVKGDICRDRHIVDEIIEEVDVVIPLVAIATPMSYMKEPLRVFELDFEENLRIIRKCVEKKKRVVFPSTSEVYGMCDDDRFDEQNSNFVLGPVRKQRWIYSCAKQLLDRVMWAYGKMGLLQFTIFRPFNWIGPKLDDIYTAKIGSSRVVTQFIIDLALGRPLKLVDGGHQKRCFTYVEDGIDCLMKIIENKAGLCDGQIFNIGSPDNECSMRELAEKLKEMFMNHPDHRNDEKYSEIIEVSSRDFYGEDYQDIIRRKPSVEKAHELLGWRPKTNLEDALSISLDYFLKEAAQAKRSRTVR